MLPESDFHREGGSQVYQISSALFTRLLDSFPVPLFLLDSQDQVSFVNQALGRLMIPGLDRIEELPLKKILSALADLTPVPDLVLEQLLKLFDSQKPARSNGVRLDTGDGKKFWIACFSSSQLAPGLDIRGGLLQDVSEPVVENQIENKIISNMLANIRAGGAELGGKLGAVGMNLGIWPDSMLDDFLKASQEDLKLMIEELDFLLLYKRLQEEGSWMFSEPYSISELLGGIQEKVPFSVQRQGLEENQEVMIDPGASAGTLSTVISRVLADVQKDRKLMLQTDPDQKSIFIQVPVKPDTSAEIDQWALLKKNHPYLVILKKILLVQGGNLKFVKREVDAASRSYLEMKLPTARVQPSAVIPETQKSLPGQGRRIIVASSKPDLLGLLTESFQSRGFRVSSAASAAALLDMSQLLGPDLILLDRDLPPLDAVQALTSLRRWSRIPVIVLSNRAERQDSIRLFEAGADDYLLIPFLTEELTARVDVILDRIHRSRSATEQLLLEFQGLRINLSTRQVWVRGKSLELTPLEFNILAYLAQRPGQVITYDQILNQAWEGPEKGSRQGLFVHLSRLRDKLEENPDSPIWIRNHWGVGYEFGRIERVDV